jgi:hypothetical protein
VEIIDNGPVGGKYIFKCKECKSLMTFDMTFFFDPDIDVYCPCTHLMEYLGA